ncbi:MAG: hypothetical protein ACI31M_01755 [Bacilli bacterium]
MKYIIKKCLILTLLFLFLFYIITNSTIVSNDIINSLIMYYEKVFPFLFPSIVITNLLIYNNFPYYLAKYFKISSKTYILLMSLLTGCPSNAVMIRKMLNDNNLSLDNAEKVISYTQFNNPIFLYNILNFSLPKDYSLAIIIINYLSSFIILFLLQSKEKKPTNIIKTNYSISQSLTLAINNTIETLILILGTIIFFNIIPLKKPFKGLLEITNGLNNLPYLLISTNFKAFLAIIYISFGGLCIIMQIKSIMSDTLITYKYYFKYRIIHLLLSMLLFCMLLIFQAFLRL